MSEKTGSRARTDAFQEFNEELKRYADDRDVRRVLAFAYARMSDEYPDDVGDWDAMHFHRAAADLRDVGIRRVRECWLYIYQHQDRFGHKLQNGRPFVSPRHRLTDLAALVAGEDLVCESDEEAEHLSHLAWRFGIPARAEHQANWSYVAAPDGAGRDR